MNRTITAAFVVMLLSATAANADNPIGSFIGGLAGGVGGGIGGTKSGDGSPNKNDSVEGMQERRYAYLQSAEGAGARASTQPSFGFGGSDVRDAKGAAQSGIIMGAQLNGTLYSEVPMLPLATINFPVASKAQENEMYNHCPPLTGYHLTDSADYINSAIANDVLLGKLSDPERWVNVAKATQQAQNTQMGNALAELTRNQANSAIDFCSTYLTNFTTSKQWNNVRDRLFIPIAILLLLPGAMLSQVKAIVAAGTPVIEETQPFEGLLRSIVAIFLIPATCLVLNYGIDVSNSLTYTIKTEYQNIFKDDMYQSAICAEVRAFPVRQEAENRDALDQPTSKMGQLRPEAKTVFAKVEGQLFSTKLEDPCAGLYVAPKDRVDEALPTNVIAARLAFNGINAALACGWNALCAFQVVYLYYLWLMGPIVAALWVWPMKMFRDALPSWIEGCVTLCFWSLLWNTTILLMACFRGYDETGTIMTTALNTLATLCVKCAFDFVGLVAAAGQQASAVGAAMSGALKTGGAGKGEGGAAGGGGKSGSTSTHSAASSSHGSSGGAAHSAGAPHVGPTAMPAGAGADGSMLPGAASGSSIEGMLGASGAGHLSTLSMAHDSATRVNLSDVVSPPGLSTLNSALETATSSSMASLANELVSMGAPPTSCESALGGLNAAINTETLSQLGSSAMFQFDEIRNVPNAGFDVVSNMLHSGSAAGDIVAAGMAAGMNGIPGHDSHTMHGHGAGMNGHGLSVDMNGHGVQVGMHANGPNGMHIAAGLTGSHQGIGLNIDAGFHGAGMQGNGGSHQGHGMIVGTGLAPAGAEATAALNVDMGLNLDLSNDLSLLTNMASNIDATSNSVISANANYAVDMGDAVDQSWQIGAGDLIDLGIDSSLSVDNSSVSSSNAVDVDASMTASSSFDSTAVNSSIDNSVSSSSSVSSSASNSSASSYAVDASNNSVSSSNMQSYMTADILNANDYSSSNASHAITHGSVTNADISTTHSSAINNSAVTSSDFVNNNSNAVQHNYEQQQTQQQAQQQAQQQYVQQQQQNVQQQQYFANNGGNAAAGVSAAMQASVANSLTQMDNLQLGASNDSTQNLSNNSDLTSISTAAYSSSSSYSSPQAMTDSTQSSYSTYSAPTASYATSIDASSSSTSSATSATSYAQTDVAPQYSQSQSVSYAQADSAPQYSQSQSVSYAQADSTPQYSQSQSAQYLQQYDQSQQSQVQYHQPQHQHTQSASSSGYDGPPLSSGAANYFSQASLPSMSELVSHAANSHATANVNPSPNPPEVVVLPSFSMKQPAPLHDVVKNSLTQKQDKGDAKSEQMQSPAAKGQSKLASALRGAGCPLPGADKKQGPPATQKPSQAGNNFAEVPAPPTTQQSFANPLDIAAESTKNRYRVTRKMTPEEIAQLEESAGEWLI